MTDDKASTYELAECARINMDHLAKAVPMVELHPYFKLTRELLAEICQRLMTEHRERGGDGVTVSEKQEEILERIAEK